MRGHLLRWEYDVVHDSFEFEYMGDRYRFSYSDLMHDPKIPLDWADYTYQRRGTQMASPGYMGSNQLGGLSNDLSRQTAQKVSSNSTQPLTGAAQQYAAAQLAYIASQGLTSPGTDYADCKPLKTEGFKLGEIIAFRGWKVTDAGFLRSMSADVIWGPGEPMEGKTKSTAEHNGVYAYKTARDFLKSHGSDLDVYGKVALWGDIIEHELGYRAQFAKVISLEHYLKLGKPHGIPIEELRQKYCEAA